MNLLDLMQHDNSEPLCPLNVSQSWQSDCSCALIALAREDERHRVLTALRMNKNVNDNTVRLTSRPTDTQSAAARKAVLKAGTRRKEVFDLIVQHGGLTDDEIETITGYAHQSASAARNSLMRDGYVWDSGERRVNRLGNPSIVWKEAR